MSRIATKICGLSTLETVDAALKAGASHIGFNFFPKSPRYVAFEQAAALAVRLPYHVTAVGVMVDPDDEVVGQAVQAGVKAIQLHGKETADRVAAICARFGLPIWKAISVKTRADLDQGRKYVGAADFLLFDAKTPDGASLPGGMGLRFDWSLLSGFQHVLPWGLSGGLDPDSVAEALAITRAPLVDVASGVESAPGVKDVDKIAAFCKAVAQS